MNQTVINFTANNQRLALSGEPLRLASKTVNFVKAHFELGGNWDGFDSVRAVWSTDFNKGVPAVLDSLGDCVVPHEVLSRAGIVRVNLVGSISEDDVLTDRLTTCLVSAIEVCCNVPVDGTNSQTITPTQFEQFVEAVRDDADRAETASTEARESATEASESATSASQSASASAESATASEQAKDLAQGYAQNAQISAQTAENAKDDAEDARDEILGMRAEAVTLPEGSEATASYADGLLSLGIPRGNTGAKGDTGETGATPNLTIGNVETLEPSEPATATITGTAENPVLNLGIPQGDTGEVSLADLSTLLPTDTASGSIASFPDGQSVIPMVSLVADIEPIQSGTGTPSPDNVRPISGRTEVETVVSPTTSAEDGDTYTTTLGRTVYGGKLDVVSGELVVDRVKKTYDGSEPWTLSTAWDKENTAVFYSSVDNTLYYPSYTYILPNCNEFEPKSRNGIYGNDAEGVCLSGTVGSGSPTVRISKSLATTVAEFKAWLTNNPLEVVYELAEPQTIQLTPQEVKTLLGQNNIWADSGDVEVVYKADVTRYIEKKLNS